MFLRVPKRSLLKVTKSSFPRNGNQWYPYHLNVMCWSVPKRSLLKVTKSSFPCSGSQWYPYHLNFMCLRVAKRFFLRVAKRTPDQEPPLRPRNGRGSTPTPATWLRTISLGPTHEQPTCTRPTPTRRTARCCKRMPHHYTRRTPLLFGSRKPGSPGIRKWPTRKEAIHHHADTTYECHPFRILLLRRLRLPVPLTTSHCWCKSGLTPSPMSTISGGCSVKQLLIISTVTFVLFVSKRFFFPTCQVRVARFYVSLFSSSSASSSASSSVSLSDLNHDLVSSVWRAGPQPRAREFSVACRTPTAILWVQCGVPDLNREPVSSVWRAGPQPRAREFSVACRTPTASP